MDAILSRAVVARGFIWPGRLTWPRCCFTKAALLSIIADVIDQQLLGGSNTGRRGGTGLPMKDIVCQHLAKSLGYSDHAYDLYWTSELRASLRCFGLQLADDVWGDIDAKACEALCRQQRHHPATRRLEMEHLHAGRRRCIQDPMAVAARAATSQTPSSGVRARGKKRVAEHFVLGERLKRRRRTVWKLKENINRLKEQVRQLQARIAWFQEEYIFVRDRKRAKKSRVYVGRSTLTTLGGYRLAASRNCGNASEVATLTVLAPEANLSRQTLAKWESKLAASLILQSRASFVECYAAIDNLRSFYQHNIMQRPCLTYEIVSVSGDAANSSVSHGYKAHTCCIRAKAELDFTRHWAEQEETCDEMSNLLDELRHSSTQSEIWPDLIPVPHNNNGQTQAKLYETQIVCAGAKLWCDTSGWDEQSPGGHRGRHIRLFIFATDQGPDQKACAKQLDRTLREDQHVWLIWHFCLQHICHLVCSRHLALKHVQLFKDYWTVLASISNAWRVSGTA